MRKRPIFMEGTDISAERTAAEITQCLVAAGALTVSCQYDKGRIVGLGWTLRVGESELPFAMPARIEPVYQLLIARRTAYVDADAERRLRAQAERVGWRQLLRWVQAQLAMIETGMVKSHEVFMPYWQPASGQTCFEFFESQQKLLGPTAEKKRA